MEDSKNEAGAETAASLLMSWALSVVFRGSGRWSSLVDHWRQVRRPAAVLDIHTATEKRLAFLVCCFGASGWPVRTVGSTEAWIVRKGMARVWSRGFKEFGWFQSGRVKGGCADMGLQCGVLRGGLARFRGLRVGGRQKCS